MTDEAVLAPLPRLTIGQIIAEDATFRHNRDPFANPAETQFEQVITTMTVNAGYHADERLAFVRLRVDCDAEDAPYHFSVSHVAFYAYEGDVPAEFEKRLSVVGATMLYPFARELVATLSGRGRFGTTWISPANFTNMAWGENIPAK